MVNGVEFFLAFDDFLRFSSATIGKTCAVELYHGPRLYWMALDLGMSLEQIQKTEQFPLIAKYAAKKTADYVDWADK